MANDYILELTGVCRTYSNGDKKLEVLKGVDLQLCRGEWCCVYGASGSGKTTLMNLVGTLESPDSGTIKFDGEDISALTRKQATILRQTKLAFVFQAYHLLPELNVRDNVILAARLAGKNPAEAARKADELLAMVGLSERKKHLPSELSGGEQQRVAVARALVNDPELLLADEPTGNLDETTGKEILDLLVELRKNDPALTILMITHNPDLKSYATRVVQLANGVLVQ